MILAAMTYNVGEEPVRSGALLVDVERGEDGSVRLRVMSGGPVCMPDGTISFAPEQAAALLGALVAKPQVDDRAQPGKD